MSELQMQPLPVTNGRLVLTEELLLAVSSSFNTLVRCKRLAIYLNVGASVVDRLISAGDRDPNMVAFHVLCKYVEKHGGSRESARKLHDVLDDAAKLGMKRTAHTYAGQLLVGVSRKIGKQSSL